MTVQLEGLASDVGRPVAHVERHRELTRIARKYMGGIAWGTILLFFTAIAGIAAASTAAVAGLWPFWAAMLANAYCMVMLSVALHEAIHNILSGNNPKLHWIDHVIGGVSGFVTVIPYFGFDQTHIIHHRYTNEPKYDPDYWLKGHNPIDLTFRFFTLKFHYLWRIYRLKLNESDAGRSRGLYSAVNDLTPYVIFIAGFWGGWAFEVFMLWIAPSFLSIAFIGGFLNWLPHVPHKSQERYRDTCVILLPRPIHGVVSALTMHQPYHLLHHLFPRIPFYRYPAAFDEMRPILEAEGAFIYDMQRPRGAAAPAE